MIIDAQVHCYEVNSPQRPWQHKGDASPPHVTGEEQVAAMDKVGVDGGILVSSYAVYGYSGDYVSEVQRKFPNRFAIVRPMDSKDPASPDIIADWKKVPGSVGVRVMFAEGTGNDPKAPGLDGILKAAAKHDLAVNVQAGGQLEATAYWVDRHPDTRFVIDHLGFYQPRVKPAPADAWSKLPQLLELAKRPNVALKLTGACTMSQQGYPFDDLWDPLMRIFDAWGLERCLWGTDWTRCFKLPLTYKEGVDTFRLTSKLSDREKAVVMGGAAALTYRWRPGKK